MVLEYGNTSNAYRLTKKNGEQILYDQAGNPSNYNGRHLEYERGGLLVRNGSHYYKYNALGQRVKKRIGTTFEDYYFEGSRIMARVVDESTEGTVKKDIIRYYYDADMITKIERHHKATRTWEDSRYIVVYDSNGNLTKLVQVHGVLKKEVG